MKIKPVFNKSLIVCLILTGTITMIGLKYFSKSVDAKSKHSVFMQNKIDKLNQIKTQALERAQQAYAANPNKKTAELQPMGSDPKTKVERIPSDIGWGIGWLTNGPYNTSELWIVGNKPNYKQKTWNTSYAYSGRFKDNPKQGFIGTFVMNGASDNSWSGNWKTPQLWGSVKITNVSGNIVSFSTDTGVKGTFNLNTHEWKTN